MCFLSLISDASQTYISYRRRFELCRRYRAQRSEPSPRIRIVLGNEAPAGSAEGCDIRKAFG